MMKTCLNRALRLGAAGASIAISAAMLFGNNAWAPADVMLDAPLQPWGVPAAAHYRTSNEPTTVVRWTSGTANQDGSPMAGKPCTTNAYLRPGEVTKQVIHASGSTRVCY